MQFLNFIIVGFHTSGSWCMWVILLFGFGVIGLVLERAWYLFIKCGSGSGAFLSGISKYVKQGDYEKGLKYASSQSTPLARGVVAILQNRGRGTKAVQKAVDEVFLTEAPKVTRLIPLIPTIANLTTLTGLMGTIYGLMMSFDAIANVPAAQRAQALASGISMAMSSTLWGLTVAIPALFCHGMLSTKSDRVMQELDEKSTKLINQVEA